jgi:uncharacterized protein
MRASNRGVLDATARIDSRQASKAQQQCQPRFKCDSPAKHQWLDRRVPTFLVIDEAHNFAPEQPTNPLQARTSDRIATIAAEGRKYGLFVILATQRPQKLRKGLLSECENACLLRIQSKVERTFAAEALGVPADTVNQVGQFDTGEALMIGRWVAGTPTIAFGPARATLGGGGLDKRYWQDL